MCQFFYTKHVEHVFNIMIEQIWSINFGYIHISSLECSTRLLFCEAHSTSTHSVLSEYIGKRLAYFSKSKCKMLHIQFNSICSLGDIIIIWNNSKNFYLWHECGKNFCIMFESLYETSHLIRTLNILNDGASRSNLSLSGSQKISYHVSKE